MKAQQRTRHIGAILEHLAKQAYHSGRRFLTIGAAALATVIAAEASAQETRKDETRAASTFQFSWPDAAVPGEQSYAHALVGKAFGEYDETLGKAHGRLSLDDFTFAANFLKEDGSTHPSRAPFTPIPALPNAGIITASDLDAELERTAGAIRARWANIEGFFTFAKSEKLSDGFEDAVFNPNPTTYQTKKTTLSSLLDSKTTAGGLGYRFGNGLSARTCAFDHDEDTESSSVELDKLEDLTTGTILFQGTTTTGSSSKRSNKGFLVSAALPVNDWVFGLDAIASKEQVEAPGIDDSENPLRIQGRATYGPVSGQLGFIAKNAEGDSKAFGHITYFLRMSDVVALQGMAGLDDFGDATGGGFLWVSPGTTEDSHAFAHYLSHRLIDPTIDDARRQDAVHERVTGLPARVVVGAQVVKDQGRDKYRTLPMIGADAGIFRASVTADLLSRERYVKGQIEILLLKGISVIGGSDFTTDKGTGFEDEKRIWAGFGAKY